MAEQLVLQFLGDEDDIADKIVALEDALFEALGNRGEVDGHAAGDGTVNVTIFARSAQRAWEAVEKTVEDADDLELNAVAFRASDDDDFTVLWPPDFDDEFTLE